MPDHSKRRPRLPAFLLALACASMATGSRAQTPPQPSVKKVAGLDAGRKETGRATSTGSRIRVALSVPDGAKVDFEKLVPFLDGHAFKGVHADLVDARNGVMEFNLPHRNDAKDLWKPILRSPPLSGEREVTVSVGPEDGREFPPSDFRNPPKLTVSLLSQAWWLLVVAIAAVGAALWALAARSVIIRDSSAHPPGSSKLPPYSLAKTQAAVWFFLIFAAFVFIWLLTGNFNDVITTGALGLIGIGSGTTLGAAMVDGAKSEAEQKARDELETKLKVLIAQRATAPSKELSAEIARIEQLVWPVSRGWVKDLLTDMNGITLHRFQMMVWTVTLGLVFVVGVYQNLAMPQFDATLLGLMGISSGVYLGFKIPERQV